MIWYAFYDLTQIECSIFVLPVLRDDSDQEDPESSEPVLIIDR